VAWLSNRLPALLGLAFERRADLPGPRRGVAQKRRERQQGPGIRHAASTGSADERVGSVTQPTISNLPMSRRVPGPALTAGTRVPRGCGRPNGRGLDAARIKSLDGVVGCKGAMIWTSPSSWARTGGNAPTVSVSWIIALSLGGPGGRVSRWRAGLPEWRRVSPRLRGRPVPRR
jgi:hypothetical protein